jgi:hypothetical protein
VLAHLDVNLLAIPIPSRLPYLFGYQPPNAELKRFRYVTSVIHVGDRDVARIVAFSSCRPFSCLCARCALVPTSNAHHPSVPMTRSRSTSTETTSGPSEMCERYLQRRRRSASTEPELAASTRTTMLSGNAAYAPRCQAGGERSACQRRPGRSGMWTSTAGVSLRNLEPRDVGGSMGELRGRNRNARRIRHRRVFMILLEVPRGALQ